MRAMTLEFLTHQLELGEQLRLGREDMHNPQDLPGRFGRVVRAIDHILQTTQVESVVGGGWAVWHHGYVARLTQDVDIALPADKIDEVLLAASVSGFEILPRQEGRWPKMMHKETGIKVDILPEGARPGTASHPAPTIIPHPHMMGAEPGQLRYMSLPRLFELKIAAGRGRDEGDVIELLRILPEQVSTLRQHLATVHPDYVVKFDELLRRAQEQQDN